MPSLSSVMLVHHMEKVTRAAMIGYHSGRRRRQLGLQLLLILSALGLGLLIFVMAMRYYA